MYIFVQPIQDPDPFISCDLMDGRDAFLTMAREKHYEFSSFRRAKFSSMAMLYELHTQSQDKFVYTCNSCKNGVETRYHCTICDVSVYFLYCNESLRLLESVFLTYSFFLSQDNLKMDNFSLYSHVVCYFVNNISIFIPIIIMVLY